jgi:hypothetical protein
MKTKQSRIPRSCHYHPWTLALGAAGLLTLPGVAQADTTNAPTTLGGTPIGTKAGQSWWKRFDDANRADLGAPAYTPPEVPAGTTPPPQANRRGNPTPFDSPPFPTGEWQIGGTPIIGDPNITPDYPLMESIYGSKYGDWWAKSRIKIYGWEDFSGNISTSNAKGLDSVTSQANNFPEVYDQRSDRLEQNQFVLYLERTPDENQTDHIDWGFRFSQVYGLDYRYMISRGWGSDQLLKHNAFYGTDNPMMYVNIYIPKVADGLNITVGRIISEADIEAQLAPNNLMSSHSLLYGFDPYCQWGAFATLKLSKNWIIQGGLAAGNDVTPWETQDPGTQPTGTVMFQYQSDNNKFSFYGGGNAINNAQWGFNNIQQYVGTLTYKFNDKIWMSHETWYMYQEHCPGQTGGPGSSFGHPVPVTAPDEPASQLGGMGYTDAQYPVHPGYADEWATLNYTMFRLGPATFLTVRNEAFDDNDGNRTGYASLYSEHSVGITWWPSKLITIRPELRFDHAYGTHGTSNDPVDEAKPFDNGTRRNQFTAQFDVIYHF